MQTRTRTEESRDTIVLIDDEPEILAFHAKILARALKPTTIRLKCFEDSIAAKDYVERAGDSIISYVQDLSRPGMNGIEFFEEVIFPLTPDRRTLIITGQFITYLTRRRRVTELPRTVRWLSKPCRFGDLRACIPWLLDEAGETTDFSGSIQVEPPKGTLNDHS